MGEETEKQVPELFPQLIAQVESEWMLDRSRIYIFGYSAGGYETFDAAASLNFIAGDSAICSYARRLHPSQRIAKLEPHSRMLNLRFDRRGQPALGPGRSAGIWETQFQHWPSHYGLISGIVMGFLGPRGWPPGPSPICCGGRRCSNSEQRKAGCRTARQAILAKPLDSLCIQHLWLFVDAILFPAKALGRKYSLVIRCS
jgi:hypothetical protein